MLKLAEPICEDAHLISLPTLESWLALEVERTRLRIIHQFVGAARVACVQVDASIYLKEATAVERRVASGRLASTIP